MADIGVRRITWRTADVARVLSLGLLFLFAWKFFWMVYNALFLGLLSILLAIVLHAPAKFLSRWIPFRVSFSLSVGVFLGVMAWLAVTLVPQVAEQITVLATEIPKTLDAAVEWIEREANVEPGGELSSGLTEQIAEFIGRFVPLAFNLISAVLGSFALVVLAIFFAAQPGVYRDLFLGFIGPDQREKYAQVYDEVATNLRAWVLGKAVTMLAVGLFTWVGLTLFDIPGAMALAVLAAFMELIPNFGPTIAAIPAVAAAFAISPMTALYVAMYYFVLQQVQSAVTVPLVEHRAVKIPPAALLSWQLMLTIGFGILALFVATPLLAVIVVAVRILYLEPARELRAWDRRESGEPAEVAQESVVSTYAPEEPPQPPPPPPGPEDRARDA